MFSRYLYWTEIGNKAKIGRAIMDGTSPRYIATTGIEMPNGLAADCSGKICTASANAFSASITIFLFTRLLAECCVILGSRLYWTDGLLNRIESSDFNGGNRQVLASDHDAYINDIVIQGKYLFYTAWNRQLVHISTIIIY